MKWIDVKDKLPNHHDVILCCTKKGTSVCVFVDAKEMNKFLESKGIKPSPKYETLKFYFASQEKPGSTLNDVTHWMPLTPRPWEKK